MSSERIMGNLRTYAESAGSVSVTNNNNLENTATSVRREIRKSGIDAGFSGKRLGLFVAVIMATITAILSPNLALGIKDGVSQFRADSRALNMKYELMDMKAALEQKAALTDLQKLAIEINREANAVALNRLRLNTKRERITKNIASSAQAANAIRSLGMVPLKTIQAATNVSNDVLGLITKASSNTARTGKAVTNAVATATENLGSTVKNTTKTVATVAGGMKKTAEYLGPYTFLLTMMYILASTGAPIAGALVVVKDLIIKGAPITKRVVVNVFKMMTKDSKVGNSGRVTNITNNRPMTRSRAM